MKINAVVSWRAALYEDAVEIPNNCIIDNDFPTNGKYKLLGWMS